MFGNARDDHRVRNWCDRLKFCASEIANLRHFRAPDHITSNSEARSQLLWREFLLERRDPHFRGATSLEFTRGLAWLEMLRLVRRARRLKTVFDEFVSDGRAAEAFRCGGDFGVAQQKVADCGVGLNLGLRFLRLSLGSGRRVGQMMAMGCFFRRRSQSKRMRGHEQSQSMSRAEPDAGRRKWLKRPTAKLIVRRFPNEEP